MKDLIIFDEHNICECGLTFRHCHPTNSLKDVEMVVEKKESLKQTIFNMLISSYPDDMENFYTMTDNQAYRILKNFWNKIEKLKD